MEGLMAFWAETGIAHFTGGQVLMMAVGALLLYLAIVRGFEPLLLLPIGFVQCWRTFPMRDLPKKVASCITPIMWGLRLGCSHC